MHAHKHAWTQDTGSRHTPARPHTLIQTLRCTQARACRRTSTQTNKPIGTHAHARNQAHTLTQTNTQTHTGNRGDRKLRARGWRPIESFLGRTL